MRILTWNINGIRAGIKKGLWDKIQELDVDIACFQETKADESIMADAKHGHDDYELVFNSCKIKKGYSGVANFIRKNSVEDSVKVIGNFNHLNQEEFDNEGRFQVTQFEYNNVQYALINCYYPQGGRDYRIPFKLDFYRAILAKANEYKKAGFKCLLCGDFNTTFADIDLARPNENRKTTGCLPEERQVLDDMVKNGYVDIFRINNPELPDVYSYWDQITRARDRNVGWRIDFFLVDETIIDNIDSIEVKMEVMGSDHCPVILTLK
jgi:exodeoxyribonuclease III